MCYNNKMVDSKVRVGILRGGTGKNYVSSIEKGGSIILCINENLGEKYKTFDIFVDKNHIWHFNGFPINPGDLVNKIDVIWNTSHQSFSNILNSLSIPNIGKSSFARVLEDNKDMLKEHMKKIGLEMPRSIVLPLYQKDFDGSLEKYAVKKAKEIFEKFSSPWIVKSFTDDSNMGIHLAKTYEELINSILDGVKHEKSILVEEFISGKIASMHSLPKFRGQEIYIFPLGNTLGNFSAIEKEKLMTLVKDLHDHIGKGHYLKSDFILTPRGRVYLLGIESIPNFEKNSHFLQACESIGAKSHHVIEHMIEQGLSIKP